LFFLFQTNARPQTFISEFVVQMSLKEKEIMLMNNSFLVPLFQ